MPTTDTIYVLLVIDRRGTSILVPEPLWDEVARLRTHLGTEPHDRILLRLYAEHRNPAQLSFWTAYVEALRAEVRH